jgi:hypothetical protein
MPLPIFFVDLAPETISKKIFNITSLLNTKIKVEEPHKRREIPQCQNSQSYGHTKGYCLYSPRCVKCGEHHLTSLDLNYPTYRQNVLFAMAATLPITKDVPNIKNCNNATVFHPPQDITICNVNQHNPITNKPHLSTNKLQARQLQHQGPN